MFQEFQFKGVIGKDAKQFIEECIKKDTENGFIPYEIKLHSVNIFNPKKHAVTTIILKIQDDPEKRYRCIAGRIAEKYKLQFIGDHPCSKETLTFKNLNPKE